MNQKNEIVSSSLFTYCHRLDISFADVTSHFLKELVVQICSEGLLKNVAVIELNEKVLIFHAISKGTKVQILIRVANLRIKSQIC